jgi:Ca-activated chloride channel family protein
VNSFNISKTKIIISLAIALVGLFVFYQPAQADGIVVPDPPPILDPPSLEESWLTIRYHRVSVLIEDQIAVTRVEQEFYNQHDWEVEGTYIFPVPEGASLSRFVLWVDGQAIEGEILTADEARSIYETIVRERRDPALLEYIGTGAVQARIYPIPPGGSRKIELEYSQVVEQESGLVRYVYPLNTEKFSAQRLQDCSVRIEIKSSLPLRSVYSPTHQDRIYVERDGDYRAILGYEEYDVLPDGDFELIYSMAEEQISLNLLAYPDPAGELGLFREGYFLLMAAPSVEADRIIPRDIVLVLDTSGSMEGDKLFQAKEAARYVLSHLNPEDRFNVVAFSTGVKRFAADLQPVSRASLAIDWFENMPALGGTNINLALLDAVSLRNPTEDSSGDRPMVLLFLTDGLPTEGVTEISQILANTHHNSTSYLRLFAFGVGDDVNTELLDSLASDNGGLVNYVRPNERIDEEVSSLYAKIQSPVLSDLELNFGNVQVEEIYPPSLPDLFSGTQLLVAGRFRLDSNQSGRTEVSLTGMVNGERQVYQKRVDFLEDFNDDGTNSFIPRLWAARKIGYLLNQIRYQGENSEWVDAVIKLSLRYGIITPYTSFLVQEDDIFSEEGWSDAAEELARDYAGPSVGADAVEKAESESNLRSAESVPQPINPSDIHSGFVGDPILKFVDDKTFFLQNGIWIDSQYDTSHMVPIQIGFMTPAYYDLLDANPGWGKILAIGERVIFVSDGEAVEIVSDDKGVSSLPPELIREQSTIEPEAEERSSLNKQVRSFCTAPFLSGLVIIKWKKQVNKRSRKERLYTG